MAKVAKKSTSSAKKSVATKKVVAKKVEKQKNAPVKATTAASKKKAVAKPVAKKAVPVKKSVAKKVTKAAPTKKVAPKVVAKKAVVKAVTKAKPAAKGATKNAKLVPVAKVPAKKVSPPAKKPAVVSKPKVVEVAKKVVAKVVEVKKVVEPKKVAVNTVEKKPTPPPSFDNSAKPAAKPRRKKKKKDDDDDDEEVVVFRKPSKQTRTVVAKKTSSRHLSEELTMEGPAPKRVGTINMSSDEKIKLKKNLLNKCIDIQKNTVAIAKKAMEDALNSANAEKVSEELSDSFRESMHATRDMYARQANEGVNNLGLLHRINIVEHDKVKFGSVVFTNFQNYFVSTGIGEIKIDDLSFHAISTLAPLFQILLDKRKGDTFMFLDRLYTVIEVF
jgi:predicted metal-binding transcription factor (methanogenesis marker protein 9)